MEAFRQAVYLIGIEDGIGFEKRDAAFFVLAFFVLLGALDGPGIDNGRRLLPFADLSAQLQRLTVGHPKARPIATGLRLHPEQQCIDAPIGKAIGAQRTGEGSCIDSPGTMPRTGSGCQLLDDLSCDALVYVSAGSLAGLDSLIGFAVSGATIGGFGCSGGHSCSP